MTIQAQDMTYLTNLSPESLKDLRRRLQGTVTLIDRVLVEMSLTPNPKGDMYESKQS